MEFTYRAIRRHIEAYIREDRTTFHGGWPGIVPMDTYFCELGSRLAEALAREVVASSGKPTQEQMTAALAKRFEELSAKATGSEKFPPGPAWKPFEQRVRNYLSATAFVPRMKRGPDIDGKVGDAEWGRAAHLGGFRVYLKGRTLEGDTKHPTRVHVGYDDKALYVAYVCPDDVANLVVNHDRHDSGVWRDDAGDFVIMPPDCPKDRFYHYIVNSRAVIYDSRGNGPGSADWNSKGRFSAGRDAESGAWVFEASLPWSEFGGKPESGAVWRAQFCRIDREGVEEHLSCWAPSTKGFNNADDLGVLIFE